MKRFTLLLLLLSSLGCYSQLTKPEYKVGVVDFINIVKKKNRVLLAEQVSYPLNRQYPLPPIRNKKEFLARFNEVFDAYLINEIITSKPTKDWSDVGYRGIMLNNGELWIDYDGTLIGVNHQSDIEKKKREALIVKDRNSVHASLRGFRKPIHVMKTSKFLIRIDEMANGNYRYASWTVNKSMRDKPELIINNGTWTPDGSGGNHYYQFKNGAYTYQCYRNIIGEEDSPDVTLTVSKGGKDILVQDATLVQ